MTRPGRRPAPTSGPLAVAVLVAVLGLLAGCATVPGSSDVSVLRRVGDAAEPSAPPGPTRGAGPLEVVRGWVQASGSTAERHEAARGFLTAAAAGRWDDGAAPVVVSDEVDTVFADRPPALDTASVRVRATRLGTLSPAGAFLPGSGTLDLVVDLVSQDGQWRISGLPPGTVVRRSDLHTNTRAVRTWFAGAAGGLPVAETRYLQVSPARSTPARALDLLAGGPSTTLAPAVTSALPPGATLRASEVPDTGDPGGALAVEAAGAGSLDATGRILLARQVVLTLAGIGVPRVRLTADGAALVPGRAELGVSDVLAGIPAAVLASRDLPTDQPDDPASAGAAGAPAPLVTVGGRVTRPTVPPGPPNPPEPRSPTDPRNSTDPADPTGLGPAADARSAEESVGGDVAVVAGDPADPAGVRLLVGRTDPATRSTPAPVPLTARTLTPPSWSATGSEVWTVADGTRVVRVLADPPGPPRIQDVDAAGMAAAGPITSLTLSPDGARVAAVTGGLVVVGVVVRDATGTARVASAQVLRAGPAGLAPPVTPDVDALTGVVDTAWSRPDRLVAVGVRPLRPVSFLSVDGLDLDEAPTINLSPPMTAVTATPGRPVLAVDQGGLWSLADDGTEVWRSVAGAGPGAVPAYPG